ncbi:DUF3373 family protein [Sulfurovum sp. TSL1]|uniref:DUF3373 family protein n=1 Tax=Sulfurovum sp. TSL1 TaxID=2826994 RepID=UPI001CC4EA8D|nr:DUF3373 family protein [Sulfurovum sp. TSL1]GIT99381.1 hypothetical protein TSL1_22020 [Sulfurovum sp. TSL1]
MKKILTASLVATLALTSVNATSIADLEAEIAKLKKKDSKLNKKINEVKAHDAGDNIKWGVDMRTSYDNINYDMADGSTQGKDNLYSYRLWLNMAYAPDANNVFKGQLSTNKAMGASFDNPMLRPFDAFDWTTNEALRDTTVRVRQAYWLYLGENAFGMDMPWTFSIGRRPSTNGFLANLSQDDAAASPLGHIINVEYDGLSSKLDLSKVTGVPGMSIKLCAGNGSTNAVPLIGSATPNADVEANGLEDIQLAGFILEPFNNGQIITKALWFKAFDLPDLIDPMAQPFIPNTQTTDGGMLLNPMFGAMQQVGDIQGGAFSAMVDGITEDGYFSDAKVFGSIAYSQTDPDAGSTMLGSAEDKTGTSYWFGAYLPVTVGDDNYGKIGLEYNHGSKYWRSFTYAEDTMAGSKLATRGDAYEANWTYQINEALSMQLRYVQMDYEYTGSNGFFGSSTGTPVKIDDIKAGAAAWNAMTPAQQGGLMTADPATAMQLATAAAYAPMTVETAKDFRFYIRYRF